MPMREDQTYRNMVGGHTLACTCVRCASGQRPRLRSLSPATGPSSKSTAKRWFWCLFSVAVVAAGLAAAMYFVGPEQIRSWIMP